MWQACARAFRVRMLAIACAGAIAGCASAPPAPVVQAAPETSTPTIEQSRPIPAQAQQQFDEALALIDAGKREQATQQLQALSASYPEYAGPLLNLGILQIKAQRFAEAETSLKAALQRDPNSAAAYNYLGIAYRNLGKFKESEAAYQRALGIDDNYALAHLNLGVLCDLYLQEPERALSEYERYLQLTAAPEPQVSGWVKELQRRAGGSKAPNSSSGSRAAEPKSAGGES